MVGDGYIVIFAAREAKSSDGSVVTPEGREFVVTKEPEGWVPATSSAFNGGVLPVDAMLWSDRDAVEKFMNKWSGHPWYARPRSFKVLPVHKVFEAKLVGYKATEEKG